MICNAHGPGLTKAELGALLAFAAKSSDESKAHFAIVHFIVHGDRCAAYATDGHRALECDGESDTKRKDGEWLVAREFLDAAARVMQADQVLRLCFSGASLTEAHVEDKQGIHVSTFQWSRNAANPQMSFPDLRKAVQIPQHKSRARTVTLNAAYMADLKKVVAASGREGVDLFPPEKPDAPLYFRVQGDASTVWTGVVMPMRAAAAETDDEAAS